MTIKWFESEEGVPIPVIEGAIQIELALFMHEMVFGRTKRGGRRTFETISNIKWHMKMWFDYLSDLNPPVSFADATYTLHLEAFRESLLNDPVDSIEPQSFNQYYGTWRSFYTFCASKGIPFLMEFPALVETRTGERKNNNNYLLAHTHSHEVVSALDPGKEIVHSQTSYADKVINLQQFVELATALGEDDPVYEAIAHAMLQTGLRIEGVMQWPVGPGGNNKAWLRYAEMKHKEQGHQYLYYWPKGKKKIKKCLVMLETMESIHNIYVTKYYKDRYHKYEKRFGSPPPSDCLWLNKHGKPITKADVWSAFRKASKKIGFKVTPHVLRHTCATYIVWNYFKTNDIPVNIKFAQDVYYAVKDQLGHESIESTEIYIRTILKVQAEAWLPELTPSLKESANRNIPEKVQQKLARYFELND